MQKYKVSVSKKQKRYSIVLSAESELDAKHKIHAEWYSILGISPFFDEKNDKHKFYFEAQTKNGIYKKWKIVATDPLKVYIRLRDGLDYTIISLYSENDKDARAWEKKEILNHLKDQYDLYTSRQSKNLTESEQREITKKAKKNLENFYIKKQLDETYRLIDFVLLKLKNILEKSNQKEITKEKKEKLMGLYNSIIKVKKTTNVSKLKEIGEKALIKIWKIELKVLERNQNKRSQQHLKETNDLLKKIGSKERFIEKDKDIALKIKKFFKKIKHFKKRKKEKKEELDKESSSYWKTKILIDKYKKKKRENSFSFFKNIYLFLYPFWKNREKIDTIFIRRKIIKQNIIILNAKLTWKIISYTKIIKWFNRVIDSIVAWLKSINNYLLSIIYIFSIIFIFYIFAIKYWFSSVELNFKWIFAFLYLIIGSILIFFIRGMLSLSINFALFLFLFIIGIINF